MLIEIDYLNFRGYNFLEFIIDKIVVDEVFVVVKM